MKKHTVWWVALTVSVVLLSAVPKDAERALDGLSGWHIGNSRSSEPYPPSMCSMFQISWIGYSGGAVTDALRLPQNLEAHLRSGFVLFWPITGLSPIQVAPPSTDEQELKIWVLSKGPGALLTLSWPNGPGVDTYCVHGVPDGRLEVRFRRLSYLTRAPEWVPQPSDKTPAQARWLPLVSQMKTAVNWYARSTGKIPATPEIAATVVGPLVPEAWTPEVRQVWSALISRLKIASGLPLDGGQRQSLDTAAANTHGTSRPADSFRSPIWFRLP
jgi:hypothetical protein